MPASTMTATFLKIYLFVPVAVPLYSPLCECVLSFIVVAMNGFSNSRPPHSAEKPYFRWSFRVPPRPGVQGLVFVVRSLEFLQSRFSANHGIGSAFNGLGPATFSRVCDLLLKIVAPGYRVSGSGWTELHFFFGVGWVVRLRCQISDWDF